MTGAGTVCFEPTERVGRWTRAATDFVFSFSHRLPPNLACLTCKSGRSLFPRLANNATDTIEISSAFATLNDFVGSTLFHSSPVDLTESRIQGRKRLDDFGHFAYDPLDRRRRHCGISSFVSTRFSDTDSLIWHSLPFF
jgi:hypothetical protein